LKKPANTRDQEPCQPSGWRCISGRRNLAMPRGPRKSIMRDGPQRTRIVATWQNRRGHSPAAFDKAQLSLGQVLALSRGNFGNLALWRGNFGKGQLSPPSCVGWQWPQSGETPAADWILAGDGNGVLAVVRIRAVHIQPCSSHLRMAPAPRIDRPAAHRAQDSLFSFVTCFRSSSAHQ
jgi:hypothetical protein